MKILLLGKNGQIGWELQRCLLPLGDIIALGRGEADLSRPESLRVVVQENNPDVIINAAAYTAVDKAEEEEVLATTINGVAPGVLAEEAGKLNALLIHYSTDYVFDGTKRSPYLETDTPNPVNAYGRTKLAGELAIQSSGCEFLIFRTSWIFSSRGENFLLKLLKLAGERRELNIVNDQTGSPTWASTVAEITRNIILLTNMQQQNDKFASGIYNIVSSGETTWFKFAEEVLRIASNLGMDDDYLVDKLNAISSDNYQTAARRPVYSVLSTVKTMKTFSVSPEKWQHALQSCMASIQ